MYGKELREKFARHAAEMRALSEKLKSENRGFTPEEREQWGKMVDAYDAMEKEIKDIDDMASKMAHVENNLSTMSRDQAISLFPVDLKAEREKEKDVHARAFSKYLRGAAEAHLASTHPVSSQFHWTEEERGFIAQRAADPAIRNAMSTTTGSQGGFIIPQGFSGMLEEAKKWFGGIKGVVDIFQTGTGNPFPWPTINDTTNKGRIIGQNIQVTETDLVFGQVTFNAYIGSTDIVLVPLALIEDSFFNLDALVARLLGIRMGRLYNFQGTVGTGSSAPTGIVTAAVAAGSLVVFPNGQTTSITYNNLVDIEHQVDPAYRYNPASYWMFADGTLKVIKKLVDGQNRPLWQPGLTASFREGAGVAGGAGAGMSNSVDVGSRPQILEHPYIINQDMATPAASANTILFGDMNLYKVREVASGFTVLTLRERYADFLQVGFIGYQRFDGNLIDAGTHPIAVGQQSAT